MNRNSNYYGRNYVCLTKNMSKTDDQKMEHVLYLMKRRSNNDPDTKPQFVQLIHRIRTLCIIRAYFPKERKYDNEIGDIKFHPGWNDLMTPLERDLLDDFNKALNAIEIYKDTAKFDIVDRKFGTYRHNKWLESQNKK